MTSSTIKKSLAATGVMLAVVLCSVIPAYAAVKKPAYRYTYAFTGEKEADGQGMTWGMTTDAAGNVYLTGAFQGTIDFDPTAGVNNVTAVGGNYDIFFTKINADETYAWTRTFGGNLYDSGRSIKVDLSGNVYVAGTFQGTADFNPTGVPDIKTAPSYGGFLTKTNADGTYGWTRITTAPFGTFNNDIAIDHDGKVYVASGLLEKLNPDGSLVYTRTLGGGGMGVAIDGSGNVYVTGYFSGTKNFNPGGLGSDVKVSAGSQDIFLTKVNTDGSYGYTRTAGGLGEDIGNAVTTDIHGNVYFTGYYGGNFTNSANFDPGSFGGDVKTSAGVFDVFLTKINANGTYALTNTFGGVGYDYGNALTTDANGNVYLTGNIASDTIDFDPTAGTDMQTAAGTDDAYLTVMNADGTYGYSYLFGGTRNDYTDDAFSEGGVAVTADGIFLSGRFYGSSDFDPTSGIDIRQAHGYDMVAFLTKLNFPVAPPPPPPSRQNWSTAGTITVIKQVINDHGGAKLITDFPLFVSGSPVVSGEVNHFAPAAEYEVTEASDVHYVRTFSGDCDVNGRLSLKVGEKKVCTITNDDIIEPPVIPPVPPVGPPPVLPPPALHPPVVGPPLSVPPAPALCALCAKLSYDLYIVNPDGSERHTGTDWVLVTDLGHGIKRYAFEDATLDPKDRNYDHNDVVVDADFTDCQRVVFTFVGSNADWRHRIRVRVAMDGGVQSDTLLVNDSKAVVGTSKSVNLTVGIKSSPACSVPVAPLAQTCSTTTIFSRFLGIGSVDPQVQPLQNLLQCLGIFPANLSTTGYFGPITQGAVKQFQTINNIAPLGTVGQATREALGHYIAR